MDAPHDVHMVWHNRLIGIRLFDHQSLINIEARKQLAFAQTEATPTQNREMAGISLVRGDEDFEMVISSTDLSLRPGSVKWSDWVDEVYDDEGYIHF
jgi:hypothetical protein